MQALLAGELAVVLGYVCRTGARPWLTWVCTCSWPGWPPDACTVQCVGKVAHTTLAWTAASSQHMLLHWFNMLQLLRVVAERRLGQV